MSSPASADVAALLRKHGQEHLLPHFDVLDATRRASFEAELRATDFDLLARLVSEAKNPPPVVSEGEPEPPDVVRKGDDAVRDAAARAAGEALLRDGKAAALVVAGGQGSRLGHHGPKGTFPATPVKRKSLFRLFSEKVRALGARYGRPVPFLVMTSEENHADTVAFFEANDRFGLLPTQLHFFTQGMLPAVDESGRLVLKAAGELFRSPNGHGGTLQALHTSGLLAKLRAAGVEEIFYFQVDNPLAEVCDPVFLGGHRLADGEFGSKVVAKSGPDEKVGVMVRRDGRLAVVEYSDLPASLREARTESGALKFGAGNIAVHVLRAEFVSRLVARGFALPYHVARKKLPCVDVEGRASEVAGFKFETFVFDALAFARNPYCLEVRREREFAPIKNASGVDSPASSVELQSRLAAEWLDAAGAPPPRGPDGAPAVPLEISPLYADSPEALNAKRPKPDYSKPVYLGAE
ncbi:MAG TPA: UTP--glucose-1-phosphate uridylyltransferase [Planctomycetota bacterium]|nr:UTP--glucose-1-phosphate uridylyltransferase [Planctomycetota bacterium]